MALRYADSFDHEDVDRYNSATNTWGSGRRGTTAFNISDTGPTSTDWHFTQAVSITDNVLVCGLAYKLNSGSGNFLYFRDGTTTRVHLSLSASTGINLGSYGGTTLSMGTPLLAGTWYYIEFRIEFDAISGTAELRINGDTVDSFIGTTNTDYATIDNVFVGGNNSPNSLIEDFVVLDGAGTTNNDFLGDVQVHYILPSADGAVIQLDGSDGDQVDNYDNISEPFPSIAEYNGSTTIGNMDLYALTNTLSTASDWDIRAVQVSSIIGKESGDNSWGRLVAVEGGSTQFGEITGLSTSYLGQFLELDNTPSGSTWAMSTLSDLEIGFQVTGTTGV